MCKHLTRGSGEKEARLLCGAQSLHKRQYTQTKLQEIPFKYKKKNYCEDGQTLEQTVQSHCVASVLGDTQN